MYSLPTEVEWEIAARAMRSPSVGPVVGRRNHAERFLDRRAEFTLQSYAHFRARRSGPTEVGTKLPNRVGLYDVHGNVAEWCLRQPGQEGWYRNELGKYPIRGGSIVSIYARCRAGARSLERQDTRKVSIGFRLVARRR